MSPSRKVALVTGASSGIGADAAVRLAAAGFEVYGVARRVERMQELTAHGVRVFGMDVTDPASMAAGVDRVLEEQGRVDVLVNNAGYGSYGALESVEVAEARRQFDVNVFGLAELTQLVVPHMRAQGDGRVVNVASVAGRVGTPLGGWYHASKFAVEGLSDAARLELAPHGVKVVVIEPGPIRTEWNAGARESLVTSSEGSDYEAQARRAAAVLELLDRPGIGSPASAVGRKILRAATARWPRARYRAGRGSTSAATAGRVLPDRVMDAGRRVIWG